MRTADIKNFLQWYREKQRQFLILTRLANIIFSIPPSQVENERDFSFSVIFTGYCRANLSIYVLGQLFFIQINSDLRKLTPKTPPDIFYAHIEPLQYIIEDA